jgi:hypothetical protein
VGKVDYRYQLLRGDDVVATVHRSPSSRIEIGDRIEIGGRPGIMRMIEPQLGEHEPRLVVQLVSDRV